MKFLKVNPTTKKINEENSQNSGKKIKVITINPSENRTNSNPIPPDILRSRRYPAIPTYAKRKYECLPN